MRYRLGIDIGGTFTDFTVVDERGTIVLDKAPSSRQNPASSIAAGLDKVASRLGLTASAFLDRCEDVVTHGSTVAVNTLIQHNGARVGLLCTEGFRDFMGMRGGHKERRYDFRYPPPPELVPRYLSVPVRERVDRDGAVVTPLHEEDVLAGIERFRAEGVEAVAVCYLWSFRNPAHERRTGELLAEHLSGAYRSLSVDVLPQIRDYVRTSTTVVNAYLGPGVRRYVEEVREMFRTLGYEGDVRFMLSNGGAVAADMLVRRPVASINSGPASGPIAGTYFGDLVGNRDVLTIDMGGTSFDISLVQSGQPRLVRNVDVHRYRVGVPMIDINTLGAGGGSIGWIDPSGILRVGPQSAESRPGPACYGHGGERPTVTDADLVLGYLDPSYFLGGEMALDREAAETALRVHVAEPLGLTVEEAAVGMFRVVNQNMVDGIREVSIERGYDPRDSVMVVGGGAGAVHACPLAEELEMRHVLVPRVASTLCAFGQLVADIKHDYTRSVLSQVAHLDPTAIPALFQEMEVEAARDLAAESADPAAAATRRSVDMRYVGQIHEVDVEISAGDVALADLVEAFHLRHEALYTYAERYSPAEVINVHLSASIARPPIPLPERAAASPSEAEPK
ncbi:MAG: hydantoinase/oxoprolinase family protein, partial [Actinobacteria bacterium]|nr:hydantoinase/oxoprolinase family protein [Actinomycetota bacterium]